MFGWLAKLLCRISNLTIFCGAREVLSRETLKGPLDTREIPNESLPATVNASWLSNLVQNR